jgi:hypothetical protein
VVPVAVERGMAVTETTTLTLEAPAVTAPETEAAPADDDGAYRNSRRRFTIAVLAGIGVMVVPYLWTLWDLWSGTVHPLRAVTDGYFYSLQARAMFHGHLWLQNGVLGIEAFVHDGHQYTYFGVFPSLLRMPVLLLTSRYDGDLTPPSMLLAWLMTGLFSSLTFWRLRVIARGRAVLGRAEAASFGVLMATIMGGSVILYLAATPFVFNEDFAWSIPLTVGSMFALLGVMERPSTGRVWASGILIFLANLNRTPTGYACVIGAGLVALWFVLGRGGDSNRRWGVPMFAVALVAFAASCAITYLKFGTPVGLPMADQIWAQVNAHRRYFLAANGGKAFSVGFLPSTIWAYFQPFGIRFSTIFPFVSTPTSPAAAIGAVLDVTYPTASMPATMPLLFLLSCWGTIAAFRPKAFVPFRLTRIVLLTGVAATSGVMLWGYINERYMADFMPFLIVASGIGLIAVWRHFGSRSRKVRLRVLGVITVVALYCVVVNLAIAMGPSQQFTQLQVQNFVSAQESLSLTSLAATVHHGDALPSYAPYGQLYIIGNCSGLYFASGVSEANVPGQDVDHYTWIPVEQNPTFSRDIWFTFNGPAKDFTKPVTLMTYGAATLLLEPAGTGGFRIVLEHPGKSPAWPTDESQPVPIYAIHQPLQVEVTTDPNQHQIDVNWFVENMLSHYIAGPGPGVVHVTPTTPGAKLPEVTVSTRPGPSIWENGKWVPVSATHPGLFDWSNGGWEPVSSSLSLCRSLQQGR